MLRPLSTCLVICAGTFAHASGALTGPQIQQLIAGAAIELDAPLGNKLPVSYSPDGVLSGEARGLASYLGSSTDRGKWWVSKNRLCHKWSKWFDGELQCLELSRQGSRLHWQREDGTSGTASIVREAQSHQLASQQPRKPAPSISASVAEAWTTEQTERPVAQQPVRAPEVPKPAAPPAFEGMMSAGVGTVAPPKPAPASAPKVARESWATFAAQQPTKPLVRAATPAPQVAASTASREPLFKVANVAKADMLNVREGPSAEHDIVGSLSSETSGLRLTGPCQSRWCPVVHNDLAGWVNRAFLASEDEGAIVTKAVFTPNEKSKAVTEPRDSPEAPRTCLTSQARALLERIETHFGRVQLVSTCRAGATIAGSGRPSRHASGNAIDFNAGNRKQAVVDWLIANHQAGGTMTYHGMDHIHVDIGPHFVSIAGGMHIRSHSRSAAAYGADQAH